MQNAPFSMRNTPCFGSIGKSSVWNENFAVLSTQHEMILDDLAARNGGLRDLGCSYSLDQVILFLLRFGSDGKSIQDARAEGISDSLRWPVAKVSLA